MNGCVGWKLHEPSSVLEGRGPSTSLRMTGAWDDLLLPDYSNIGEQHGFWTGLGSISSTRVKLGS